MRTMYKITRVECICGRTMAPDGRFGRGAFRCGCRSGFRLFEELDPVRRCTYGACRTLATTKEPLRFCPEHEEEAASLLAHTAGVAKLRELDEGLTRSRATWTRRYGYKVAPMPKVGRHAPLVYFARRERLIKIGTSVRVRVRMHSLGASVLATEPGDVVRETQLHRRFAHLLVCGREWFRPGPDLITYINELRAAEGAPPVAAEPALH